MDSVELWGYEFDFTYDEKNQVGFKVVRLDRSDATQTDRQRIEQRLNELGKWETIMKAFSDLDSSKNSLDIRIFTDNPYQIEIRMKNTQEETNLPDKILEGTICLSAEERNWREGAGAGHISVDEVCQQLRNVDKWRNLQRAISSLRPQSAKP
jgi:hypothetical protein